MSAVPLYPIPRRLALSAGMLLVRWARSPVPPPPDPVLPRAELIRRHRLSQQLEREREAALRRALTAPLAW
ncbi:hypothetical protein [Brevibacterium sp.]|uniref:hypothetical protein n=1 Tax=Brevibacterium sp. TaxID=1701 RepID=UPI0025BC6E6E|nr:hypothetical protein [Brevibacterium sp.]